MSSSSIAIKVICSAAFSTASLSSSTEDYKNPQTDSICNIRTVQTADSSYPNIILPYTTNYQVKDSKNLTIQDIYNQRRFQMLNNSFEKHNKNFPPSSYLYVNKINAILNKIPFEGSLVEYDEFDESVEYCLILPFNIYVRISCFMDDEDVTFTIHRQNSLLVADEMPVSMLAEKLINMISNIQSIKEA